MRRSRALARVPVAADHENPTVPYLVPLLVNLALLLVTGLGQGAFDALYALRILIVGLTLVWLMPGRLPRAARLPKASLVAVGLGVAVFPLWLWLASPPESARAAFAASWSALSPAARNCWFAARAFGATFVIPVIEELAFRGYLLRRLFRAGFDEVDYKVAARQPWPLLASSIAFGAMHHAIVPGTLAGLAYGLALVPRGRLTDAIAAHMITNGLLMAYVLATQSWPLLA